MGHGPDGSDQVSERTELAWLVHHYFGDTESAASTLRFEAAIKQARERP
jgi:hypothetical protein